MRMFLQELDENECDGSASGVTLDLAYSCKDFWKKFILNWVVQC